MLSAVDTANSINYATAAAYAPSGALSSLTNNASFVETNYYNSRLQPCRISVKSSGTAPTQCSDAANIGNVLDFTYNFSLGSADNGNIAGITNNRLTTRSQTFAYDSLNRIATAQTTSTFATSPTNCWGEAFFYDNLTTSGGAWGNLTKIQPLSSAYTGCTQESGLSIIATNKNQISGDTYDAAGNLINDGLGHAYTFNAENQLLTAGGVTYTYDGDGKRVKKSSGTLYWYGAGSDALSETDSTGVLQDDFIFFAGARIARYYFPSSHIFYYFADHVGTARSIVQSGTTSACYDADFYPFGGERSYTNTCTQWFKFTGKERDSESGLDNFGARYNSSNIGRFITTDPLRITKQKLIDPQQWNMYAYVRNNPLRFVDPTGMYVCSGGESECAKIKAALDNVKKAADAFKPDSEEKKALDKVLKFYGDEGKENGVSVKFGDAGGAEAKADTKNGKTTITFDLQRMNQDFSNRGDGSNVESERAGTVAHEGTHGIDDTARGSNPRNRQEETSTEENAFGAQAYVNKGLGVNSAYGLWDTGWAPPEANRLMQRAIDSNAQRATDFWCAQGGNCQ